MKIDKHTLVDVVGTICLLVLFVGCAYMALKQANDAEKAKMSASPTYYLQPNNPNPKKP